MENQSPTPLLAFTAGCTFLKLVMLEGPAVWKNVNYASSALALFLIQKDLLLQVCGGV